MINNDIRNDPDYDQDYYREEYEDMMDEKFKKINKEKGEQCGLDFKENNLQCKKCKNFEYCKEWNDYCNLLVSEQNPFI
ncbi:hypothetical protein SAMN02194393_04582 [Maledivibacter halophilus]|uniref:Uncharacterized protein n=2 Tax=Maledivibacter halophilus TaxID=36842 RepID=A0A1T5MF73_9FIRM|nr:hypothetical protein SAMN02194393_04582 [Maledivibacter halophilus]